MKKEIFLSHAWGNDDLNRNNHERCKQLCDKLISDGYTVWFDQYDMYGNIDSAIIKGINNCRIVLICLTKKYSEKINNAVYQQTPNDNCYKEWNYSLFKQKILIPIIMESQMIESYLNDSGVIQMYLNSTMFINMANSIETEYTNLHQSLKKFNVFNKLEKKIYEKKKSRENIFLLLNSLFKKNNLKSYIRPISPNSSSRPSSPSSSNSSSRPSSPNSPNSFNSSSSQMRNFWELCPPRHLINTTHPTSPLSPKNHIRPNSPLYIDNPIRIRGKSPVNPTKIILKNILIDKKDTIKNKKAKITHLIYI